MRVAWINTGAGLRFKVLLDRAMDIADAAYNQYNLSWLNHAGFPPPQPFSDKGLDWLRTFGGGLVATCGLSHVGGPEKDAFGERGVHGNISNIPAEIVSIVQPDPANGSNNWVVSGSKTQSGKPILANDPHLSLTLPSIWYEIQLTTPTINTYGVSFPGIPGVVIGYNDSIAFGFTNAGRDVKDYYEIQFKDKTKQEYFFDSQWVKSTLRVENIKIKDSVTMLDTVAYTVFGPVTYDHAFKTSLSEEKAYALRWVAHDTSNVLKMWMLLNSAKNYNDYYQAISHFNVPGQNMIFASATGDIALWQQGTFPLRWKDQGLFVMPGKDSSYMWKGYIPMDENPHSFNPESGFLL
jgi:penicillin amidase